MFRRALSVRALGVALALCSRDGHAQAQRITIETAVQAALSNHPDIQAAAANTARLRGDLRTARSVPNPELELSVGPTRGPDTTLTSVEVGVFQLIESGGKRGARSAAASAQLRAAEWSASRQRQLVALNARRAFWLAVVAQQRAVAAMEADTIGAALVRTARERSELGVGTTLETNLAIASAARDRRDRLFAEQELARALFEFRAAIGVSAGDEIDPDGVFELPGLPSSSEEALVAEALLRRPDLLAVAEDRSAAASGQRLARAMAWPDPFLGFSIGRDETRSHLLSVGVAVPLWNRAGGHRAAADADFEMSRVAESAAQRAAEREVREAYRALANAIETARTLERDVVIPLGANLELTRESFDNGKISLVTYNLIRRDLVAARLEYFDALTDVIEHHYQLSAAIGGE